MFNSHKIEGNTTLPEVQLNVFQNFANAIRKTRVRSVSRYCLVTEVLPRLRRPRHLVSLGGAAVTVFVSPRWIRGKQNGSQQNII